jgi:hypothetical protein
VKQFPEAYENASSVAAAIVDSMVNENEVCG